MGKSIVGEHAKYKRLQSNILQISQDAKALKKEYDDVIDATVGMLHHEDGTVFKFPVVDNVLHHLNDKETYYYAPVRGTKAFREGVFDWVFGKNAPLMKETFYSSILPTTGGSGAISNTFYNFIDFGDEILIPNHYWTPYENFALEANAKLKLFAMYDENLNFNQKDFAEKARELANKQERLTLLLNDPCNNPTGLCMSRNDWDYVIQILNEIANKDIPVVLIQDIAYIDYQMKETEVSRDLFLSYLNLDPKILAVVIFSGSKTFSLYGFRVGAQIALSKDEENIKAFDRVGDYSIRARFSSVSQPGMNVIEKIFTEPECKASFEHDLIDARKLLLDRANLFLEEAKKQDLKILPYSGGFFVSVKTKNKNIFEDLKKDHVFVIQMDDLIRIAISSLPLSDIPELVRKIKKHI